MTRRNPGGVDPDGLLAQLDKKLAAIKDATRQANEAIQGVKEVMREAKAYRADLEIATQKAVDERVAEAVAIGLETFKEALDGAMTSATEATYARFDQLIALLLGEDKATQRLGRRSYAELVLNKAGLMPHKYSPLDDDPDQCIHCRIPQSNKEVHPE